MKEIYNTYCILHIAHFIHQIVQMSLGHIYPPLM